METTLEQCWFTNFREHQMGQPTRGNKDQVSKITPQNVQDWANAHCVGKNLIVAVTGDASHEEVVNAVSGPMSGLASSSGEDLANLDKPIHTPSLMYSRDDEMANVNVCVFFKAPSWTNEDYFAF